MLILTMSSQHTTADFILEQIATAGVVRARKMFGEYGIYCDEKFVAVICDDEFYVKPTEAGRAFIGKPDETPPYPGAKKWFRIPGERWDDSEWMGELVALTARTLPQVKKSSGQG